MDVPPTPSVEKSLGDTIDSMSASSNSQQQQQHQSQQQQGSSKGEEKVTTL